MRDGWYYAEEEKPVGPLSFDALVTLLRSPLTTTRRHCQNKELESLRCRRR